MYRMAHFPPFIPTAKLNAKTSYPWYDSTKYNSTTPLAALGAFWELQGDVSVGGGNSFIYVKNVGGALAQGEAVAWKAPTAGTFTLTGSTVQKIYTNITTTQSEVGNWLYCLSAATGGPWLRQIKRQFIAANAATETPGYGANTVFVVSEKDPNSPSGAADIDAIAALPSNGVAVCIIRPFQIVKCTDVLQPIGVALGTVADGNYTIIHVSGMGLLDTVGNGANAGIVVGEPCAVDANGKFIGTNAVAPINGGASSFKPLLASTAASAVVPFEFNCIGNL